MEEYNSENMIKKRYKINLKYLMSTITSQNKLGYWMELKHNLEW